jgi:hypothetical protein
MRTYFRSFENENEAFQMMVLKNRACKKANNFKDAFVLVDGPNNNFVVMDDRSAIEGGFLYQYSC